MALVAFPFLGLASCGELVTEVIVDVVYEGVKCDTRAAVAAGPVGELGERPASATSTVCDEETGSLGRVVISPRADDGAEFGVEVRVRPDGQDPDKCVASNEYDGCIVARRIVSYIPGRSVTMRIDLRNPCVNTPCDEETTCIARGTDKACTTAHLDLEKCEPNCNEDAVVEQSETGFSPCKDGFVTDQKDASKCVDVDECETGEATCDAHATCENTKGSFSCTCYTGYEGDGTTCTPIKCPGGCADNATCKASGGTYSCVCDNGFLEDGDVCTDIDECETKLDDCPGDSTCKNTRGAYDCICPDGFELGAAGCSNVNECELGTDECPGDSTCKDNDGSYSCVCADGFELDESGCSNVNECELGIDECPGDSTCVDTEGSYECTCPDGFDLGQDGCVAQPECVSSTDCPSGATCENSACVCPTGYELGETECTDIDECQENLHDCPTTTDRCVNIPGGFSCAPCSSTLNVAASATGVTAAATTTYGSGYHVNFTIDGNTSTAQTNATWCSDGVTGYPQYVTLTFPEARTVGRLELYTSDGFAIRNYDLEYEAGADNWVSLAVVTNNSDVHRTHTFTAVTTTKFRVVARSGSASQLQYARLNELQLFCQ